MEMAATKRQPRILILLVCAILYLSTANAIRILATDKNHILKELYMLSEKTTDQNTSLPIGSLDTDQHADQGPQMNDFEENCNNGDEEEDCLMRRTLAAHVDYIYTQQHNHPVLDFQHVEATRIPLIPFPCLDVGIGNVSNMVRPVKISEPSMRDLCVEGLKPFLTVDISIAASSLLMQI